MKRGRKRSDKSDNSNKEEEEVKDNEVKDEQ